MVYFISDIHLGFYERTKDIKRETLLIDFLDKIKSDADTLYIAGDLFDYWFEYKHAAPKYYYRTLAAIYELKKSGVKIEYLMGNHDFGHKDFFRNEFDIEVHKGDIAREINGKKFYLSHGDGKSHKDTGYKILRSFLRHPAPLFLFKWIHPDIGISLASGSSKKSRAYTDNKDYGGSDGMREFAESKIREGFDYVVMGHRHKAIFEKIGKGYYVNLGDWIKTPHFGRFDGESFKLKPAKEFLMP